MKQYISAKQISILYRKFQSYINNELKKYDINSSEYSYLLLLYENNYELSQDSLHKMSGIDRAAITRAIHSLEKKGYVNKKASDENSRHNIIVLTQKAIAIEKEVFDVVIHWNNLLHSVLTEDDLKTTVDSLTLMAKKAQEVD